MVYALIIGSKGFIVRFLKKEKKLGWNMAGKKILNPADLTSFHQTNSSTYIQTTLFPAMNNGARWIFTSFSLVTR